MEPKKEPAKKSAPKKEPKKKDAKKEPKKEPKKEAAKTPPMPMKDPREVKKFGPTPDDLYGVAWSNATKTVATAGYAGNISVWDLKSDKPMFTTRIKSPSYCIAFAPDGKSVVSGHDNGTVQFIKR